MAEAKTNVNTGKFINCNKNTIIIAIAIVLVAVTFMFFRDRQQKRQFQLERLDTQMDVMERIGTATTKYGEPGRRKNFIIVQLAGENNGND